MIPGVTRSDVRGMKVGCGGFGKAAGLAILLCDSGGVAQMDRPRSVCPNKTTLAAGEVKTLPWYDT